MNESYVPIFFDWPEATQELTAQEKGRLIDVIVCYARGDGDWQDRIKGNERYVFPMFRAQMDRARAEREVAAQAHRESGKLGGRPKRKPENQINQNGFDGFSENQNNLNNNKDNNKNNNDNNDSPVGAFDTNPAPDDAPQAETIEAYVMHNLHRMSPGNLQDLAHYTQELPSELIRYAVDEAVANQASSWAYVRTILNSLEDRGIRTVAEAKAADDRRKAKRRKITEQPRQDENPLLNAKFY